MPPSTIVPGVTPNIHVLLSIFVYAQKIYDRTTDDDLICLVLTLNLSPKDVESRDP